MRLAVSNIAWPVKLEDQALSILEGASIEGVEIAPTRLWPEWRNVEPHEGRRVASRLAEHGLSVPALQAILFGKPECELFGSDAQRQKLKHHLLFCADLAVQFGAPSLVFGAPKNRELKGKSLESAFDIAVQFFSSVAPEYAQRGVRLCMEANPTQYGCEFATRSSEAARLVRAVDSAGFRLHLDTACMLLAAEDVAAAVKANFDIVGHFHVSQPFLGSFDTPALNHSEVAETLRAIGYDGWISLEMRETEPYLANLRQAVRFLKETYSGDPH